MDINDQKGPQIDQLSIIHLLFKKFLWFFDFYVVGQGDQHNDKVGQGDQLMEIVGHKGFTPPHSRGLRSSPEFSHPQWINLY